MDHQLEQHTLVRNQQGQLNGNAHEDNEENQILYGGQEDQGNYHSKWNWLFNMLIVIISLACAYQIGEILTKYMKISEMQLQQGQISKNQPLQPQSQTVQKRFADIFVDQFSQQMYGEEKIKISQSAQHRVQLGQPTFHPRFMSIVKISRSNRIQSNNNCAIVNGLLVITQKTIKSSNKLLQAGVGSIYFIVDRKDNFGDDLLKKSYNNSLYNFQKYNITIDADYQFLSDLRQQCKRTAFLQNYFEIDQINAEKIVKNLKQLEQYHFLFADTCVIYEKEVTLQDLTTTDLNKVDLVQLSQYLFIFDPTLLANVGPLNFAYYNKYTLEELIIYPLLALAQGSSFLAKISDLSYKIDQSFVQFKEMGLQPARPIVNQYNIDFCFVSYPSNPYALNLEELKVYLQSIKTMDSPYDFSIIIYLPYTFAHPTIQSAIYAKQFFDQINQLQRKNFKRLRIIMKNEKAVSSLSNYQSAYTYCPSKSLIVASRHNVIFSQQFANKVFESFNVKYHYYFTGFYKDQNTGQTKKQVNINQQLVFPEERYKFRDNAMYFNEYFQDVQIFKSDLFKMIYFQMLKSCEIDFYETQASFVLPMLEMIQLRVGIIHDFMYTVKERIYTNTEAQQIENIKTYFQMIEIPNNMLIPYPISSLSNIAFRRNAPDKIPKNIHQAWIGEQQPSQFRWKLHRTIKQANPQFSMFLWRDQNLTVENFPISYALIHRSLEYQRYSDRSYNAPIVSLLRYEALYRYGGIYLDFKTEGLKPLNPFLKYEIFFTDATTTKLRYGNPDNLGNPIMGACKNSYYLKFVLTQLILQEKVDYQITVFPTIVGAYILRKAFNFHELFTKVGLGFHLFSPRPEIKDGSKEERNLCLNTRQFSDNQQVFQVKDSKSREIYRIGIPCRAYPQAYAIQYKPLGRTWVGKKSINI